MKKIIFSLISLALMFSLVGVVSAADLNVDNSGTCNDVTGDPYCTIQAAIDFANSGDTIQVAAGTYIEQIIINKSITLQGASKETTIIEYPPTPVSDQYLVLVKADDVTIKGFKLLGHFATGNRAAYIVHSQGAGLIVESNEIQGFIGVFGNLINGQIRNNIIGTNRKGIYVPGGSNSLNLLIEGNTIEPAGGIGSYAYNCGAIYMDYANDVTIQGNIMRDFSSSIDSGITAGRGIEGSDNNGITIFDNTFENIRDAITMWIVTDIDIDENTIINSDRYGINIKGQNINIVNNKITGSGDSGVRIDEHIISTQNVNVNFNNIVGNTNYGIKNGWSGEVNAEYNWWGIQDGSVIAGMISGDVDYDPWLCEEAPTGLYSQGGICYEQDRSAEITSPLKNEEIFGNVIFSAILTDDDTNDSVQWAVRKGTCAAGTNTVFGNVDGHNDVYVWDGVNFSATTDTTSWIAGSYCFIFNPTEGSGEDNIRLTREFMVNVDNTVPIITFVEPVDGSTHSGIIHLKATCNEDCDYVNFWWRADNEVFAWYRYHYVHDDGTIFEWDLDTLNAEKADGNFYTMTNGVYYLYAAGKDLAGNWARTSEIMVIVDNVQDEPQTKADVLMESGVPGKGLENAPGLQKPFNPKSQAGKHAGKK